MKNNCCFKMQKNGVFLFGISFYFRFSDIDVFILEKLKM